MEDLDALLADLQSTTANISLYQKSQGPSYHSQHALPQEDEQLNNFIPRTQPVGQGPETYHFQITREQLSSIDQQNQVNSHQPFSSNANTSDLTRDQTSGRAYPVSQIDTVEGSYHSDGGGSDGSTPPPLPPPPLELFDYDQDFEPVYEQQTFHIREAAPSPVPEVVSVVTPVSTQSRDRGQRMSALSNNLSELDQLLQDLNSAQFMVEVERKSNGANEMTVVNGTPGKQPPPVAPKPGTKPVQRTSVDNLLDQLEGVGGQPGRFPVDPNYQELSHVSVSHSQQQNGPVAAVYRAAPSLSSSSTSSYHSQPQTASSATKELDELMMSLSEFRKQSKGNGQVNPNGQANPNEPAYAKPMKSRSVSSASSASSPTSPNEPGPNPHQIVEHKVTQEVGHVHQTPQGNGLEMMLGDLQSDMNRQGVNIKQKGVCAACQKPIVGQVIAALGRTWHVEHFVCAHCEEPLGTRNFYERDSLAYCEKDYHNLFAPRCACCNGPIVDKCITALEKMWHPEHFFCAQCGRLFGEEDFHEKNGKAYCRDDYFQLFAPKCGGCAQPIMEHYITALNRQWHPECFVCWDCHATFGAGSFFDYDGLPYCETHYHAKKGSLCASCERPITGRCITAMFRKFHPEHFVCAFCLKQLNKGTFKEQNDKPYCHPCFVKLFG